MKKRLVVLFATALCLWATVPAKYAWAADPGSRYADAFVLIEQGQAAEEKSDLATAYRSYQSALSILHSIRTDAPEWNAQMVEYRLKDCQSRFDAVKTKLPEPPPAPATAASVAPVVTPAVQVPTTPPSTPTPPPAPAVKTAPTAPKASAEPSQNFDKGSSSVSAAPSDSAEVKKLRAELNKTRAEADAAKKSAAQIPDLQRQNKDLNAQLAAAEKKAVAAKLATPAPAPVDTAELKKLRAEADNAHADADKAHKAAADLEKQNKDLSAKLAAAEKKTNIAPADSSEVKNLRAQLDKSQAEVADLKKQVAAKPMAAPAPVADSGEVRNLRAELDKSKAEVADLKKQVAAKPAIAPAPVADSSEVKSLRAQLAETQKELGQAKNSASQVSDLERQNKDLSAKLAAADKKATAAAAKPAPVDNSAELKKLHDELDATRAEADRGKKASARVNELEKENKDLSAKLTAEKKAASEAPTEAPDVRVMKQLRNENSYLRNLLDTYAEQNSELKGQLHRHDLNQGKSGQ